MKFVQVPADSLLTTFLAHLPFALDFEKGPWVAGGAPRRFLCDEPLGGGDIDVFFASYEQYEDCAGLMRLDRTSITPWSEFYTLGRTGLRVNLVHSKQYESAQKVIDDFDFVHCQFITDGKVIGYEAPGDDDIVPLLSYDALAVAKQRRLLFLETDSVPATLRRALKYAAQGFTATDYDFGSLLMQYRDKPALVEVRDSTS